MRFINIHVLFAMAAANPNRDDAGAPKTCIYGGVSRSRISSQAMTRPKRLAFETGTGERTTRSRFNDDRLVDFASEILDQAGVELTEKDRAWLVKEAARKVSALTKDDKKKSAAANDGKPAGGSSSKKDVLTWLAEAELRREAAKLVNSILTRKGSDLASTPDTDWEGVLLTDHTSSLAIAAFGRMFANAPGSSVHAAVQRSHAITTHEVAPVIDYFTAVEEVHTDNTGAAHIGLKMLTSGVFYWHANVDVEQLRRSWDGFDDDDAQDKLAALFLALFTALPTGSANTTGHHVLPAAVVVLPAASPASAQTAFEQPIQMRSHMTDAGWVQGGFLHPSVDALLKETRTMQEVWPDHFGSPLICVGSSAVEVDSPVLSLPELAQRAASLVVKAGVPRDEQ